MSAIPDHRSGPRRLIDRIGDGLASLCAAIAGVSLLAVVAINGTNVVARYLFGSPYSWAEELMLFLMILSVFTGAITVTWRNMHIRIDTFIDRAPPAIRRAAMVIGSLVAIAALATITHASTHIVILLHSFDQRSDALNAPSWIPQSFVALGLGTIALLMAIKLVLSLIDPPSPPATAEDQS